MKAEQHEPERKSFDQKSLRDLVMLISKLYWSKRIITITLPLIFAGFGFFYAKKIAKPIFLAEYTLNVGPSSGITSGSLGIVSSLGLLNMGNSSNSGYTIASYISSRDNFESVYRDTFKRKEVIEFLMSSSSQEKIIDSNFHFVKLDQRFQDSVISFYSQEMYKRNLAVFYDKKNSTISMEFRHENEEFCLFFAEKLIQNAQSYFQSESLSKMDKSIRELKFKADSTQSFISATLLELAKFSDQSNALIGSRYAVDKNRMSFGLEIAKLTYAEYLKALEMARANKRNAAPEFKYFDAPRLPLKKERLSAKKAVVLAGTFGGLIMVLLIILANRKLLFL